MLTFLQEFAEYLDSIVFVHLITGDLHVDDAGDSDALTRHVKTPTHRSGHSLGLIITRDLDNMVQTTPISACFLSDHCAVPCNLAFRKLRSSVKEVC